MMFAHLFKIVWKRKARNLMLSLEIMLAFIVVFAVAAFAVRNYRLYETPLGFNYANVWNVDLQPAGAQFGDTKINANEMDVFKRTLEAMPEVERVAYSNFALFINSTMQSDVVRPEDKVEARINGMQVSDDFFAVMQMNLVEGRWFSELDEGADKSPIVINKRLADELFPGQSAVGKTLLEDNPEPSKTKSFRVVGVCDAFRGKGEYMTPVNFVFWRTSMRENNANVGSIVLKVKPGVTRAFENKLNKQLKQLHADWGYRITTLADLRESQLRNATTPLMVLAIIGAFLLLMVAFGLFGVLWQNTMQRIPEFGLRRAVGANANTIYGQIVVEQILLGTLSVIAALLLLVQIPIAQVFGDDLNWPVFITSSALTCAIIYGLSLLCALYPAWRASRFSPTEALHYE